MSTLKNVLKGVEEYLRKHNISKDEILEFLASLKYEREKHKRLLSDLLRFLESRGYIKPAREVDEIERTLLYDEFIDETIPTDSVLTALEELLEVAKGESLGRILFGDYGIGKTHTMLLVASAIRAKEGKLRERIERRISILEGALSIINKRELEASEIKEKENLRGLKDLVESTLDRLKKIHSNPYLSEIPNAELIPITKKDLEIDRPLYEIVAEKIGVKAEGRYGTVRKILSTGKFFVILIDELDKRYLRTARTRKYFEEDKDFLSTLVNEAVREGKKLYIIIAGNRPILEEDKRDFEKIESELNEIFSSLRKAITREREYREVRLDPIDILSLAARTLTIKPIEDYRYDYIYLKEISKLFESSESKNEAIMRNISRYLYLRLALYLELGRFREYSFFVGLLPRELIEQIKRPGEEETLGVIMDNLYEYLIGVGEKGRESQLKLEALLKGIIIAVSVDSNYASKYRIVNSRLLLSTLEKNGLIARDPRSPRLVHYVTVYKNIPYDVFYLLKSRNEYKRGRASIKEVVKALYRIEGGDLEKYICISKENHLDPGDAFFKCIKDRIKSILSEKRSKYGISFEVSIDWNRVIRELMNRISNKIKEVAKSKVEEEDYIKAIERTLRTRAESIFKRDNLRYFVRIKVNGEEKSINEFDEEIRNRRVSLLKRIEKYIEDRLNESHVSIPIADIAEGVGEKEDEMFENALLEVAEKFRKRPNIAKVNVTSKSIEIVVSDPEELVKDEIIRIIDSLNKKGELDVIKAIESVEKRASRVGLELDKARELLIRILSDFLEKRRGIFYIIYQEGKLSRVDSGSKLRDIVSRGYRRIRVVKEEKILSNSGVTRTIERISDQLIKEIKEDLGGRIDKDELLKRIEGNVSELFHVPEGIKEEIKRKVKENIEKEFVRKEDKYVDKKEVPRTKRLRIIVEIDGKKETLLAKELSEGEISKILKKIKEILKEYRWAFGFYLRKTAFLILLER